MVDDWVVALEATVERFTSPDSKHQTHDCRIQGCRKRTSHEKPYCVDHVEFNPYVIALVDRMSEMSEEDIVGGDDPFEEKERRRQVVPVEVQVGESRYWVGLVKSRGVEKDPEPTAPQGPRVLYPNRHVRLRPFTRLLTRSQSRYVLLCLQEREAERIPLGWYVDDVKLVADVLDNFHSELFEDEAEAA